MSNPTKNRTKRNLFFQISYQILNVCIPLVTTPYLARVLGVSQLGVFSYSTSVVSYFTLFAMLGTINYGTRCIASNKDNPENMSKSFWGIFYLQLLFTIVSLLAYVIFYLFYPGDDRIIFLIQGISILSCFFDISWFFFGIENFKSTVLRNFIFRLLSVSLIFLLVRKTDDLWIYTIIMTGGVLLNQMSLFLSLPKYIKFKKVGLKEIFSHLKPNLILFLPLLAMSVYHSMDKTMLGIMCDNVESGLYYNADKIINIPVCVIVGIGMVMLPRITSLYSEQKDEEARELFFLSLEMVGLLCVAMGFGIAAISKEFVPIFFGEGYENCIILIQLLAPVLLFKGISDTIRTQYLIPLKKESIFIIAVLVGAVVNLALNFVFIPMYGAMGAVIATMIAEFVSFLVQFIYIVVLFKPYKLILNTIIYLLIGTAMFFVVRAIALININPYAVLAIEVIVGGLAFVLLFLLYSLIRPNPVAIYLKKDLFKGKIKERN